MRAHEFEKSEVRRSRYHPASAFWLLTSVFCILTSACVPSVRPTIKIGLIAPFEGRYREIGQEVIYAARLAVREANARGGVGGYSIELTSLDDGGDAAQSAEQARKLATDPQMVGVIGSWLDWTTLAAAPALADSGIAQLATTSAAGLDPAAFRLWMTQSDIESAAPDSLRCPAPCDLPFSLDWLSQHAQDRARIAGPPLWGLSQFPRLAGQQAEGVAFITPAPLPADSTDPSFADRYRSISPGVEPRFLAVLAYDAAHTLFAAIERDAAANRAPTRAGVYWALGQIAYDGLSGRISFDSTRSWAGARGWVYYWREGQIVSAP